MNKDEIIESVNTRIKEHQEKLKLVVPKTPTKLSSKEVCRHLTKKMGGVRRVTDYGEKMVVQEICSFAARRLVDAGVCRLKSGSYPWKEEYDKTLIMRSHFSNALLVDYYVSLDHGVHHIMEIGLPDKKGLQIPINTFGRQIINDDANRVSFEDVFASGIVTKNLLTRVLKRYKLSNKLKLEDDVGIYLHAIGYHLHAPLVKPYVCTLGMVQEYKEHEGFEEAQKYFVDLRKKVEKIVFNDQVYRAWE